MRRLGRSSVSKLAAVTGFLNDGSGSRTGSESDQPGGGESSGGLPAAYTDPELMDKEPARVDLGMAGVLKFAGLKVRTGKTTGGGAGDGLGSGGGGNAADDDEDDEAERHAANQLADMEVGDDDAFD